MPGVGSGREEKEGDEGNPDSPTFMQDAECLPHHGNGDGSWDGVGSRDGLGKF